MKVLPEDVGAMTNTDWPLSTVSNSLRCHGSGVNVTRESDEVPTRRGMSGPMYCSWNRAGDSRDRGSLPGTGHGVSAMALRNSRDARSLLGNPACSASTGRRKPSWQNARTNTMMMGHAAPASCAGVYLFSRSSHAAYSAAAASSSASWREGMRILAAGRRRCSTASCHAKCFTSNTRYACRKFSWFTVCSSFSLSMVSLMGLKLASCISTLAQLPLALAPLHPDSNDASRFCSRSTRSRSIVSDCRDRMSSAVSFFLPPLPPPPPLPPLPLPPLPLPPLPPLPPPRLMDGSASAPAPAPALALALALAPSAAGSAGTR